MNKFKDLLLVLPEGIPRKECPSLIDSALDLAGMTVRESIWEQRDGLDEPVRSCYFWSNRQC